jgi:hypothetical protein
MMKKICAALLLAMTIGGTASAQTAAPQVCEDFLRDYHACAIARTPEPERSEFLRGIELARKQYARMAMHPLKPDVAGACIEARKMIFDFLSKQYGCAFK